MFDSLKKSLLSQLVSRMPEVTCPKCGHRFQWFGEKELTTFGQLTGSKNCPSCGQTISPEQIQHSSLPQSSTARPPDTKIEVQPISQTERIYNIPRSGKSGGLLFFTILWNLISWTLAGAFLMGLFQDRPHPPLMIYLFVGIFPAIGVVIAYAALRQKYATHLLYLGPDRVRLRRELFRYVKDRELPTREITGVQQVVFYTQNYKPIHGIEILAGKQKLRFGSMLTPEEKGWLCHEIRTFLLPTKAQA